MGDSLRHFVIKQLFTISVAVLCIIVLILVVICAVLLGPGEENSGKRIHLPIFHFIIATTSTTPAATTTSVKTSTSSPQPTSTAVPDGPCEINPLGSQNNAPLLLRPESTTIVYPGYGENTVKMLPSDALKFICPETQIMENGHSFGNSATATCRFAETFDVNGKEVTWSHTFCSSHILPTVKQTVSLNDLSNNDPNIICNNPKLELLTIGFQFGSNSYLNIVNICFNTTSKVAVYSNYNLTSSIAYGLKNVSTPHFKEDSKYYENGMSLDKIYQNSKSVINEILGLDDGSDKYINNECFIDKGHLADNTDFYYAPLQMAVNRYVNVVPQWSSFNRGNWFNVELSVRTYASQKNTDLQIWTGTYGNAVLESSTRELKELYLYKEKSGVIPVPAVFWKIVYSPLNQTGLIFVGHNNPYSAITKDDEKICSKDVSAEIWWMHWDKNNVYKGYSYACECNDSRFHYLNPYAPKLTVKNLLL